jgi:hypothetical protein
LPEFPPAIFLQNRPELGDASRGQVLTLNNFRTLFKEILTPVQLEGLRLLLTPRPQKEFNLTDDPKSPQPQQKQLKKSVAALGDEGICRWSHELWAPTT